MTEPIKSFGAERVFKKENTLFSQIKTISTKALEWIIQIIKNTAKAIYHWISYPFSYFSISGKKITETTLDDKDENGRTALHVAAEQGNLQIVRNWWLRFTHLEDEELTACMNPRDNDGNTPLHLAVKAGREEMAKELAFYWGLENAQNNKGETPLHIATRLGFVQLIDKVLIPRWADVHVKDENGKTPIDVASEQGNQQIVDLLLRQVQIPRHLKRL
ncbi:MAG: ankyrin repeat domain-containing protein [Chlamydiales bacterium]